MGNKKKLKRRLAAAAASAAANNTTLADKLNTVKSEHGIQENVAATLAAPIGSVSPAPVSIAPVMQEPAAAPIPQPPSEPTTSVANAMDDWEDEDESTDGGTISAEAITVNNGLQEAETPQPANPNIDVPSTAPQENETMQVVQHNAVNHPAQTVAVAAPTPAPSVVIENSTILPQSATLQMQQDAAAVPPAAAVTAAPAPEQFAPVAAKPKASFHALALTMMVTLDLSNFEHLMGLKSSLSRVKLDGQELNLYSPFRKAGKKADTNPAAEGIVRYALANALDITDTLNNNRIMTIGDEATLREHLVTAVENVRDQITNLFPASMETVVANLEDAENEQTIQLQLSDIVNVRSWVNSSSGEDDGNNAITLHNAVINLTVNAGFLYDTEDRIKYINQVKNILKLVGNSREDSSTTLLLSVNLDSSSLADKSIRTLLDALLENEDFTLYTRQEMHRLEENDFLPQSAASVDADLLAKNGDLLLLMLLEDEDDAEGDDEAAAAVAE